MEMLERALHFFIYIIIELKIIYSTEPNSIILKMSPEEVINTVKTIVSSDYMRQLANDFATKTAEHIFTEIQNQDTVLANVPSPVQTQPQIEKIGNVFPAIFNQGELGLKKRQKVYR
jgi:hypothetical protein